MEHLTPIEPILCDEGSALRLVAAFLDGRLSRSDFYTRVDAFLAACEQDNELRPDEDTSDELRRYAGAVLIEPYNQHYYGAEAPEAERYFPMLLTFLERGAEWWRSEVQAGRWPPYEFFDPDPQSLD